MGEHLKKPYEISVWEDELAQDGSGIIEKKIAVIGSDTMTGLNKVYGPVFNKKDNGEKTLSFSLKYKYFDPYSGNEEVINPFAALLVNERKVKLKYGDKWYEFIVKDHVESSDELTWTYTCTDAFVLELSKNGYNITFDAELNNNQGTAKELAEETLKDTDWRVGKANIGRQLVPEPIYNGKIVGTISVLNTDTNRMENCSGDVYVFYSHIKNKDKKFIQFIKQANKYVVDDKNVITATNYRILQDNITITDNAIKSGEVTLISLGAIDTFYQANRLAYNQRTTYDSVMGRTVDLFKADDREIYRYTDYNYTTSNVVMNYITNGDNFNVLEDGTLQGWNPYVDFTSQSSKDKIDKLELVVKPELGTGKELADISALSQIEGFLKVQLKGALTSDYKNAVYNSGIENNTAFIESISKGQKFVFRWRAGKGSINNLTPVQNLGLIVAKYTQDAPNPYKYYYKHIDPNNIVMRFTGTPKELNNYIRDGELVKESDSEKYNYLIDGVIQTPSTKYIYVNKTDNKEYVWNGILGKFELKTDSNYLPYYYLTTTAERAIPNNILTDPTQKYGIFIYTTTSTSPIFIQDIQLTRFIPDAADETGETPVLIGNVPTAAANYTEYYYLKPSVGEVAENIETYTSIDELAAALKIYPETIQPVYNEESEKILSIKASQSNCFNILQTIAETFECWIDLVVEHDERGYIVYKDGRPQKYVYLNEYAGKDNWAGFKYGINLQSIERTVNSDEIVTKLIVDLSQSDYVEEGFISIANAPSNQSGESYILNFDYYYNQGLLDRETVEADRLKFVTEIAQKNLLLKEKEQKRNDLETALTGLGSNRNVYTELIASAEDMQSQALAKFETLTGQSYEDYKKIHHTLSENNQFTEEGTIFDILGELYVSSAAINNYSGILTNVEQEYWNVRKQLRGSENYNVKVWTGLDNSLMRHVYVELSDYLPGFSFEIGGSTYSSTVSKKYFDLETDKTLITFTAPDGYSMETTSYSINDNKVAKFKITSNNSFEGIEDEIEEIREQKDELVKDFNNKYSRFIQEGTWNSSDYIDPELYYLDALQVSNTSAQPTVSYNINVVEVSELEGLELYSFDAGEKTYIEDTEFFGWANVNGVLTPAREEVIISEVEWHLDEPDKNVITVQNYKTRFEDLFQRINAAVQTVQYNEVTYAKMSSLLDANGTINQNVLLESLSRISGKEVALTSNGSVIIQDDVILVQNLKNPANRVIINSEGIRVSSDGGLTWQTAIDGQGVNAGAVYTGTLNTNEIIIGNRNYPSFRWDKAGISAFKSTEQTVEEEGEQIEVYDLQTYVRYDQYGLYGIKNGGTFKASSIEDIKDKAHFAVTWDGFFIKNSYTGGGKVQITSDNDFQVINSDQTEKIKIGALEWTVDGVKTTTPVDGVAPSLYGIRINNNAGDTVFKTGDDGNLEITGTIYANAGQIGGMTVNQNTLKMNHTIFEKGKGIYSDLKMTGTNDPVFIISDIDGTATFNSVTARGHIEASTGTLGNLRVIDTITVETAGAIKSANYSAANNTGWLINNNGATFNNAKVRGTITALQGDFLGAVNVGDKSSSNYIIIDGTKSVIQSSNFEDGAGPGWLIDSTGDAYFNNITAKGAIKTAVFEYAEIQAVGGIFLFRPSSTIRSAEISGNDLILKVEKPMLFTVDSWCKLSNFIGNGIVDNPEASILVANGLTHVYRIKAKDGTTNEITLEGAKALLDAIGEGTDALIGGALVDMGKKDNSSNYGIGVNSSDNTVNLPRRAITLFETRIDETQEPKVTYQYRGVLGTLPNLNTSHVSSVYSDYMAYTQGIYTDNMYIGNKDQYIAFYTDREGDKHLKINAKNIVYEVAPDGTEKTWEQRIEEIDIADSIDVIVSSSNGDKFLNGNIATRLTCQVIKGGANDVTADYNQFTWKKYDKNGNLVNSWTKTTTIPYIDIASADVDSKATFTCEVEIEGGEG